MLIDRHWFISCYQAAESKFQFRLPSDSFNLPSIKNDRKWEAPSLMVLLYAKVVK
jgi:hypothetical protein